MDISGFSALTELDGDEHAVAVVSAFRSMLRDICSRRAVRIAKWLGDGAMLVSVESRPVLAAVLEMHHALDAAPERSDRVAVRSGATCGDVILLEGDDYIGHAINVAARLCELAEGGQLLAAPPVVDALPKWASVRDTHDVTLRGLGTPLPVALVGMRPTQGPTAADPVCGIPLTLAVSEAAASDPFGGQILFCSESCHDTWLHRPRPPVDELGSLRGPLIGS